MLNKSRHTDSPLSWLANDTYLKALHIHCIFLRKKLSIFIFYLLEGVPIVNLKTTINYNNILIKVQLSCIGAVSNSRTHSERPRCIKDSGMYYM